MASNLKNQLPLSRNITKRTVASLPPEIAANPVQWIEDNFKGTQLKVFHEIIKHFNFSHKVFPSQIGIAKRLGIRRETVNRAMAKLSRLGFIGWFRRFNQSNIYQINHIFRDPIIRRELRFMFRIFYFIPLSIALLTPFVNSESPPKYKFDNEYIFKKKSHYQENRNILHSFLPKKPGPKSDPKPGGEARRGKTMEVKDPAIVKELNLTRAGEIKLAVFTQEAKDWAMQELRKYGKPIGNVFGYYWTLCKQYHEAHNIAFDKKESFRALNRAGIGIEEPGVDPNTPCLLDSSLKKTSEPKSKVAAPEAFTRPKYGPLAIWQERAARPVDEDREFAARYQIAKQTLQDDDLGMFTRILMGEKP
jgi:hypothetical protein